jgi:hypothetical protein
LYNNACVAKCATGYTRATEGTCIKGDVLEGNWWSDLPTWAKWAFAVAGIGVILFVVNKSNKHINE